MTQAKKRAAVSGGLKLITGRRQTEWTGSHSVSNEGHFSHNRESLINRKRTNYFSFCLQFGQGAPRPCRHRGNRSDQSGPTILPYPFRVCCSAHLEQLRSSWL